MSEYGRGPYSEELTVDTPNLAPYVPGPVTLTKATLGQSGGNIALVDTTGQSQQNPVQLEVRKGIQ